MTDYSMSDELFLKRAGEEDGCMISAVGAGLARAMSSVAVNVSLNEAQQGFVQGKILVGQYPVGERPLPRGPQGSSKP